MTQTFTGGDRPRPRMVFEGDFVGVNIDGDTKAKVGTDAKVFPFPAVGGRVAGGHRGDAAVALKDGKGAQALLTFLASTDAAEIWAAAGRLSSPPTRSWTCPRTRTSVQRDDRQGAGRGRRRLPLRHVRPGARGRSAARPGEGEWKDLQDFLKNPKDVAGTQRETGGGRRQGVRELNRAVTTSAATRTTPTTRIRRTALAISTPH